MSVIGTERGVCFLLGPMGVKPLIVVKYSTFFILISHDYKIFNFEYQYAMTHEPYGIWIMAVLQTKQDVIKFALLYIPIGWMSSIDDLSNFRK